MNRIGIFLDRDGTINEDVDYLSSPLALQLIPGSAEAIRKANELGVKVFVVTNQSGIARGILTEAQLGEVHERLRELLRETGARIDAFYYCPHHAELGTSPYRMECDCRKPKTGMLRQAAAEFDIDLKKSFMIGDKMIDVQTGVNAGTTTILVLTGYGKKELALCRDGRLHPDHVAENLLEAVQHVSHVLGREQFSIS
jgi:D-glycero-D-manno-heptose 1,7-bisphosphate phosphatase